MNYRLTTVLKIHSGWIKSLDTDPYNALIASSSVDGAAKITDIRTRQLLATIPLKAVCEEVKFSKAHPYVFCALLDGLIKCYDLVDREFVREYYGHMSSVLCLDTHGRRIFSGSSDRTVRVWDARAPSSVSVLRGHVLPVTGIMFDRGAIYSCSMDGRIYLWDERSGKTPMAEFGSSITSMCLCGGSLFASAGKKVFECRDMPSEASLSANALSLEGYDDNHYLVGSNGCIFMRSKDGTKPDRQFEITGTANTIKVTDDKASIIAGGGSKDIEFLERDEQDI